MYPVVIGNGRCLTKDTVIAGFQVPRGVSYTARLPFLCCAVTSIVVLQTQVVFQHYVMSNLERYFQEPSRFLPERWLKPCKEHHAFASLPFGYGRRMCLGRRFADLEIQMVIAKVNIYIRKNGNLFDFAREIMIFVVVFADGAGV